MANQKDLDKVKNTYLYIARRVDLHNIAKNLQSIIGSAEYDLRELNKKLTKTQQKLEYDKKQVKQSYRKPSFNKNELFNMAKDSFLRDGRYHDYQKPIYQPYRMRLKTFLIVFFLLWLTGDVLSGSTITMLIQPKSQNVQNLFVKENTIAGLIGIIFATIIMGIIYYIKHTHRVNLYNKEKSAYDQKVDVQNKQIVKVAHRIGEEICEQSKVDFKQTQNNYKKDIYNKPYEISKIRNQIAEEKQEIQRYEANLAQINQLQEQLKFNSKTMIRVPQGRQYNLNFYGDVYEVLLTDQASSCGLAIKTVEDRWENYEQRRIIQRTIQEKGNDIIDSLNQGTRAIINSINAASKLVHQDLSALRGDVYNFSTKEDLYHNIEMQKSNRMLGLMNNVQGQTSQLETMVNNNLDVENANRAALNQKITKTIKSISDLQSTANDTNNKVSY